MELSEIQQDCLFSNQKAVAQICQPLFENTKITFFDYHYYDWTGGCFTLTTHPEFHLFYFNNQLYPTLQEIQRHQAVIANKENKNTLTYVFMSEAMLLPSGASDLSPEKYFTNVIGAKSFHIHHRIYFIQYEENFCNAFGFGIAENQPSIFEFYLNSLDFLERFVYYFKFQAHDLLEAAKSNLFNLPGFLTPTSITENPEPLSTSLPLLFPNQYQIQLKGKEIKFTRREMECFALKIKGNTAKEIGNSLEISHRTVEKTLLNVYEKIPHISKAEILTAFEKRGIFKLFQNYHFKR